MNNTELQPLLTEFAAERLALLLRHEAGARVVSHYDFNNTYQYVISRAETHAQWLQSALAEYGAAPPPPATTIAVPELAKTKKPDAKTFSGILEDDARHLAAFVAKWRPRVKQMSHARHRIMLDVVLGEAIEHQRLFEQAASGMEDVLGRRTGGVARQGGVVAARWME